MDRPGWEVRHEAASRRFTAAVDGHTARLEYEPGEGRLVVLHTLVPEAIGGRGIAAALVEAVLAYARASGLKVVPRCSYTARYLSRHPEYADLVADEEA
jgi:predicted GNAT family acetyltransferase